VGTKTKGGDCGAFLPGLKSGVSGAQVSMTLLDRLLSDMSHKAAIREILWRLSDEEAIQILEELLEEYRRYGVKEGDENGDERA
jgi:hypothetical protein